MGHYVINDSQGATLARKTNDPTDTLRVFTFTEDEIYQFVRFNKFDDGMRLVNTIQAVNYNARVFVVGRSDPELT